MSIVAAATAPNEVWAEAIVAWACLALAVPLVLRGMRRGRFDPSDRLPPAGSAWPLVLALAWGLLVWMAVPAYLLAHRPALKAATSAPAEPTSAVPAAQKKLDLSALPPKEVAILSTVPHLAAFFALLTLDLAVYGGKLGRLGFSLRQARTGLAWGTVMSFVFIPLVFGGAVLTEWVYRAMDYAHPQEHDLLRVLGRTDDVAVRVVLVLGATVVAPLSEELLFRGHAQTIFRRALARLSGTGPPGTTPPWATWSAIVLASALFASVHAAWTWPPIFLLSLCLGWLYERFGNLWAVVAAHSMFNIVSTLIFLKWGGVN